VFIAKSIGGFYDNHGNLKGLTQSRAGVPAIYICINVAIMLALYWTYVECLSNVLYLLQLAFEAHDGQKRKSGEPYIIHPLEVARILGELASIRHFNGCTCLSV
jgi:(p)ppGpp synthase/HD superfamily hydrolase